MGALYSINFPNGKRYIGITMRARPELRFAEHRKDARGSKDRIVLNALRRHDKSAVEFQVLLFADDPEYLMFMEKKAIAAFGTMGGGGYNVHPGGKLMLPTLTVLSGRARQAEKITGRKASPETRAKMSAARLGLKRPPSYCEKLSLRNKGNTYGAGKVPTAEETARRNRTRHLNCRGIIWHKANKCWVASLFTKGKRIYLGSFDLEADALAARTVAVTAILAGAA